LNKLIKSEIDKPNFFPKKLLGQNFLINPEVIEQIIKAVDKAKPSLIMEVGPGLGALTKHFMLFKCPLWVIELDRDICQYWEQKNINVLKGDVLKTDWESKLLTHSVLVGNLPYKIASRLLVNCCPGPSQLKGMVLMFQKEVAQRILSVPHSKSYGLLSVLAQCFWNIKILTEAKPSDFYPKPKVSGQVLVFQKKQHFIEHTKAFSLFIKFCFSQRRKILFNRLKKLHDQRSAITNIFDKMKLSPLIRPEELSPEQFVALFTHLKPKFK